MQGRIDSWDGVLLLKDVIAGVDGIPLSLDVGNKIGCIELALQVAMVASIKVACAWKHSFD